MKYNMKLYFSNGQPVIIYVGSLVIFTLNLVVNFQNELNVDLN